MNGNDQEVRVTGPGGMSAALRGQNLLVLLVLAGALGLVVYVDHDARASNLKLFSGILAEMRQEHVAIRAECGRNK